MKYVTMGVLASAYKGAAAERLGCLRHVVQVDDRGQPVKVLYCGPNLANVADDDRRDEIATCAKCARLDPRVHGPFHKCGECGEPQAGKGDAVCQACICKLRGADGCVRRNGMVAEHVDGRCIGCFRAVTP